MIRNLFVVLAAVTLSAGLAIADEGHDHGAKHGGVVEHSGHHHIELVAQGGSLALYVTHEDGEPEDVSAAKASATVLADGKTEQVALAPAGGNKLEGTGSFAAAKGAVVVITLSVPGHEPEQVRFKLD